MVEFVLIGKIVKPQGIKGEVKVKPLSNNLEIFNNLKVIFLGKNKEQKMVKAVSVRFGFAYIMFDDVNSRDDAELLRNNSIFVDRKEISFENEKTFLIDEILNSSVFDENNNLIGKLVDVEQYGAADNWIIWSDGRNYSVPYLETVFIKVLPMQKIIIVNKKAFDEVKVC